MFGAKARSAPKPSTWNHGVAETAVVWAVGDVHGQDDLFQRLISSIIGQLQDSPEEDRTVVLLGDYIDRGMGSCRVIDRVLALKDDLTAVGTRLVALKGNHEDLLLRFMEDAETGPDWLAVGGRETLLAYGLAPFRECPQGWQQASVELLSVIPIDHLDFFEGLSLRHTVGDFQFVHAGVRPGVDLDDQTPDDMMWIRDMFLIDSQPFARLIVHGHTPGRDIYMDGRRICVDTGAYATGVLSAVKLQGRNRHVLQARREGRDITLVHRDLRA